MLLKERNNPCQDIRAREVKGQGDLTEQAELVVRIGFRNFVICQNRSEISAKFGKN